MALALLGAANLAMAADGEAAGPKALALVCVLAFCAAFSMSWGPVAWILPSELVPLHWRAYVSLGAHHAHHT